MEISDDAIIKRDEIIISEAISRKIPILMVLSGGYQKKNADTIVKSIINLQTKFKIFDDFNND